MLKNISARPQDELVHLTTMHTADAEEIPTQNTRHSQENATVGTTLVYTSNVWLAQQEKSLNIRSQAVSILGSPDMPSPRVPNSTTAITACFSQQLSCEIHIAKPRNPKAASPKISVVSPQPQLSRVTEISPSTSHTG